MEGEYKFDIEINLPKDISEDFYQEYGEFIDESLKQIQSYFSELLSLNRYIFSLEIAAPMKVLYEIERYLNNYQYLTYNQIDLAEEGDENKDFIPQELFEKHPDEFIGVSILYISFREEFIHLAKLIENFPFSCDEHEICDTRAMLRGLLYGYNIKNIIGFIEQ